MTGPTRPAQPGGEDAAGSLALLGTLDALCLRAIELTRNCAAELEGGRMTELLEQLHLRDLLVREMGDVLVRLGGLRDVGGAAWTEAAEAAWQPVASRLEELRTYESELTRSLVTARDSISSELSKLQLGGDPISRYGPGAESPSIDRRG